MDKADRYYVESLIERAKQATLSAATAADAFGLVDVTERLDWAMDFQDDAAVKLGVREPNPDGTTGPARITDEGVELGPSKG